MINIYSGIDRGNEEINDGVNLRLPSGRLKDFGNLDYDVNLMLAGQGLEPRTASSSSTSSTATASSATASR